MGRRTYLFAILWIVLAGALAMAADVPAIAAAADLKFALPEVAARFTKETGRQIKVTYGSSGNFAQQIEQGAPFELFLSADEGFVFRLAEQGRARDRGSLYAIGRLVLFAPHGSPMPADAQLKGLQAAVEQGQIKRFAIANPDHAPYGRAARSVLRKSGLWSSLEPKLVLGESASQATQFASSGASQGGIIPLSLSKAPEVARLGQFALIPAEWHADEPLHQRMVLMKSAGETARAFYDYLQTPVAREVLVRYGFVLPAEERRKTVP